MEFNVILNNLTTLEHHVILNSTMQYNLSNNLSVAVSSEAH